MEHPSRRNEPGGTASAAELPLGTVVLGIPDAPHARITRPHRIVAGFSEKRRRPKSAGSSGYVLYPELVALARSVHFGEDSIGRPAGAWSLLKQPTITCVVTL